MTAHGKAERDAIAELIRKAFAATTALSARSDAEVAWLANTETALNDAMRCLTRYGELHG